MNALTTLEKIVNTHLCEEDLKYCLVSSNKHPLKIDGTPARPNTLTDFVDLTELVKCENLEDYAGIGISVQASNICAIDVDHCFSTALDITSADSRAKDILERFKDIAYCEFSFSGKGLRVLFKHSVIDDYSLKYYIKNEKFGIEYYQPNTSYRYVTITGNAIADNSLNMVSDELTDFLNTYMLREVRKSSEVITQIEETRSYEELMRLVKVTYLKNNVFQEAWFAEAPGSGKDESEKDYFLIAYLYENITQDKELLRQIFETSPYFKSKDSHHIYKWNNQEHRYYNYVYNTIRRTK